MWYQVHAATVNQNYFAKKLVHCIRIHYFRGYLASQCMLYMLDKSRLLCGPEIARCLSEYEKSFLKIPKMPIWIPGPMITAPYHTLVCVYGG